MSEMVRQVAKALGDCREEPDRPTVREQITAIFSAVTGEEPSKAQLDKLFGTLARAALSAMPSHEVRKGVLEEAARVADAEAQEFDALIEKGKGEHCQPGYVRDDTWTSWHAQRRQSEKIAAAIRTLSEGDVK